MSLRRKDFLKGLALGTISLPFVLRSCGDGNIAQNKPSVNLITNKKYRWKMVTTWPPNFPVLGEGCQLFADKVKLLSGGRMEIKIFGGGELVPALKAFDAVSSGAAEMGSGAAYYWAGKAAATQFFASVPFGMNAQQLNAWILTGGGMALWEELYAQFDLVPLLGGNTGVQMGGWFNKEIHSVDDLKGLKMRIPGLGGKVLEQAGGAPVLMAGGEIYTGLERGVIDATEWIGPYHDYIMGFYEIANYYYAPGWHEPGTALEFFINKPLFDQLPSDLQGIIRQTAAEINMWMLSEFETKNATYLQKLKSETTVDIRYFPQDVLDTLKSISTQILEDMTKADAFSRKVYTAYKSFKTACQDWSALTEEAYYQRIN